MVVTIASPPRIQVYDPFGAFLDSRSVDSGYGIIRIRAKTSTSVEVGVVRGDTIFTYSSDGELLDSRAADVEEIMHFPGRGHIAATNRGREFRLTCHSIEQRIDRGPWRQFASDSFSRAWVCYRWLICMAGIAIGRFSGRPKYTGSSISDRT